jgi:hypothetical protein
MFQIADKALFLARQKLIDFEGDWFRYWLSVLRRYPMDTHTNTKELARFKQEHPGSRKSGLTEGDKKHIRFIASMDLKTWTDVVMVNFLPLILNHRFSHFLFSHICSLSPKQIKNET